jgi:hypothetical protein
MVAILIELQLTHVQVAQEALLEPAMPGETEKNPSINHRNTSLLT